MSAPPTQPAVLSLYDLLGIQRYIFASNRLKENLGGSWLVQQGLDEWLREAVEKIGRDATLLCSGGGNAMVRCDSLETAREIATEASLRLVDDAPGLRLACVHEEWPVGQAFESVWRRAARALEAAKAGSVPDAAFDGAGVTAACWSTGEPAVTWDDDDEKHWLGPAAKARLDASPDAHRRIEEIYRLGEFTTADGCRRRLIWTHDLDKLGRSAGERSFIGVIHLDGNAMGARFRAAAQHDQEGFRVLSDAVKQAGERALCDALGWVEQRLGGITDRTKGGFDLACDADGCRFPVRPIVYGGDDITLVCDGRIALDLAAELLRAWHERTRALPDGAAHACAGIAARQSASRSRTGAAHACAGIALVRSHYPFYRAYRLAEELCRHAKWGLDDRNEASALDWEIVEGGGIESLAERRARSKSHDGLLLHARPYVVVGAPPVTGPYRAWKWFREVLLRHLQEAEDFHTQYKGLAATLHEGREVTREHIQRWRDRFGRRVLQIDGTTDPHVVALPEPPGFAFSGGFAHDETPYLDALEIMDRILPPACFAAGSEPRS